LGETHEGTQSKESLFINSFLLLKYDVQAFAALLQPLLFNMNKKIYYS
jgi:hypothetical protein